MNIIFFFFKDSNKVIIFDVFFWKRIIIQKQFKNIYKYNTKNSKILLLKNDKQFFIMIIFFIENKNNISLLNQKQFLKIKSIFTH